jgi:hypothetical protein
VSNANLESSSDVILKEEWVKAHEEFNWGKVALEVLDGWDGKVGIRKYPFDWSRRRDGGIESENGEGGLAGT